MSGEPFPKSAQLARGTRRYRRKVASPRQWQAIIAGKGATCRLHDYLARCSPSVQYHHIVPRDYGGDDVADNIAPLCMIHHAFLTSRAVEHLAALAASLADSERAYVVGKLGEDGLARLFGATR